MPVMEQQQVVMAGTPWLGSSQMRSYAASSSSSTAEATAGHDVSSFLSRIGGDDSREEAGLQSKYWVRVGRLECGTSDASLKKMFYPYGADEAFVTWEAGCVVGFVGFMANEMAALAVEKMNAFIPWRQTQALQVSRVSLDEVLLAHGRTASGQTPCTFLSMLYQPECDPHVLASVVTRHRHAVELASDIAGAMRRATPSVLTRVGLALSELPTAWPQRGAFIEELLRQLLCTILAESPEQDAVRWAVTAGNCGMLVGKLFAMHVMQGDPFQLATRLLQRGVRTIAQVDGICAIAHVCAEMPYPIAKAAFWALVGQTAQQVDDARLRNTLLMHLRQLQAHIPLPPPSPMSPLAVSAQLGYSGIGDFAFATRGTTLQQEESKRRTVYISHLPAYLPQNALRQLLLCAGAVNKVRVCVGNGYNTLFAFVEMQTLQGAKACMRLNGINLLGYTICVQAARNPIQDVTTEDAVYSAGGALAQPCLFGATDAPLAERITHTP